ncbi:hypothetical protein WJX72_006667 [[Myrmecia] bisecta]|uniref:Uncharacterized protein n=1 Tax=[Myrmecia] bisecta TaxID=41462 RepID=A0AAW1PCR4_9CHLO
MGQVYRVKLVKTSFASIDCNAKVSPAGLQLTRSNGETLYKFPLERVVGMAHSSPNQLDIQVLLGDKGTAKVKLQAAAVASGQPMLTGLYDELYQVEGWGAPASPLGRANSQERVYSHTVSSLAKLKTPDELPGSRSAGFGPLTPRSGLENAPPMSPSIDIRRMSAEQNTNSPRRSSKRNLFGSPRVLDVQFEHEHVGPLHSLPDTPIRGKRLRGEVRRTDSQQVSVDQQDSEDNPAMFEDEDRRVSEDNPAMFEDEDPRQPADRESADNPDMFEDEERRISADNPDMFEDDALPADSRQARESVDNPAMFEDDGAAQRENADNPDMFEDDEQRSTADNPAMFDDGDDGGMQQPDELNEYLREIQALHAHLDTAQARHAADKAQSAVAVSELQAGIQHLQRQLQAKQAAETELESAQSEVRMVTDMLNSARSIAHTSVTNQEATQAQLQQALKELQAIKQEHESARAHASHSNASLQQAQEELRGLQDAVASAEASIADASNALEQRNAEVSELQATLAEAEQAV